MFKLLKIICSPEKAKYYPVILKISNFCFLETFFMHFFNKYLLDSYSVLGIVLGIENTIVIKARCP